MKFTLDDSDPNVPGRHAGSGGVRRRLLQSLSLAPLRKGLRASGGALALPLATGSRAATPSCGDHAQATPRQTEGPYFTRNSPQRASLLEPGLAGTRLVLSGQVLALDCAVLPRVLLDFWQADADGAYDNRGYRLRGHQFTDAQGHYRLETVVPGLYPGRTRHIHVKLQAPAGPVLTTQLYFPAEARNRSDAIFSPALLVTVMDQAASDGSGQVHAGFDFAIRTA